MQKGSRFIGIDPRDPPAFSASQPVQRRLQFFPVFRRDRIAGVFYRPVPGLAALLFEHGSERNVKAARKLDARHRLFQRIELCAECIQHGCLIGGLFRRIDVQERLIEFRNKYPIDCGLPRVDQLFRFQRHRKRAVVILRGLIRLSLIKQDPQCKLRVLPASEFFQTAVSSACRNAAGSASRLLCSIRMRSGSYSAAAARSSADVFTMEILYFPRNFLFQLSMLHQLLSSCSFSAVSFSGRSDASCFLIGSSVTR